MRDVRASVDGRYVAKRLAQRHIGSSAPKGGVTDAYLGVGDAERSRDRCRHTSVAVAARTLGLRPPLSGLMPQVAAPIPRTVGVRPRRPAHGPRTAPVPAPRAFTNKAFSYMSAALCTAARLSCVPNGGTEKRTALSRTECAQDEASTRQPAQPWRVVRCGDHAVSGMTVTW
jgi:hypothetical protein